MHTVLRKYIQIIAKAVSFLSKNVLHAIPSSNLMKKNKESKCKITLRGPDCQRLGYFSRLTLYFTYEKMNPIESVQSTLSHLISTSVPRAKLTPFLVEQGLFQYYS